MNIPFCRDYEVSKQLVWIWMGRVVTSNVIGNVSNNLW